MEGRALTDATSFELVDIAAQISTDNKFWGAAEAANGKMVFAPMSADGVGVFDHTDDSFQLIDTSAQISGTEKFSGAVAATNGKIVLVPHLGKIGVFDATDNSLQLIDISAQVGGGGDRFRHGTLATNGKVIFAPTAAAGVGVFDATDNSFQLIDISAQVSGDYKFVGAATAQNGKIILAPYYADGVGVFDPMDDSFQLIDISAQISIDSKFTGAATAQNGKIIFAPFSADGVGIFDATDNSFQLIDISAQISVASKFWGAATAQNGKVIFVPMSADGVGIFDATDNSFQLIDISAQVSGGGKFRCAAVATSGKMMIAPVNADGIGLLTGLGSTTTTTVTTTSTTVTNTSTTVTNTSTSTTGTSTTTTATTTTISTSRTTSTTVTTTSTTVTRTNPMTQVLHAIKASEQEALARVLTLALGTGPIVIEKPNTTTVTVAQKIDVQAAAENGGFASIVVSGDVTDADGGGETNRVSAAVPVSMIQQLDASGGSGVVLMVSASKASATEETFIPGAATGPVAGAHADDAAPPTEPTLQITLAAQPVSVSVAVNGEIINIRNLREPVLITVLSVKKDGFDCAFYNETTLEWSSEGMWEHDAGNGALVCASTHLTVFAAIKKTWLGLTMAVTCVPAEFLTAAGLSAITHSSQWRLIGAVSVFVFALSQAWAAQVLFFCQACRRGRHTYIYIYIYYVDAYNYICVNK